MGTLNNPRQTSMSAPPPAYNNAPPSYGATPATATKGGMAASNGAAYPAKYAGGDGEPQMWQSDYCDCFQDMDSCCCGCFCLTCGVMRNKAWLDAEPFGGVDICIGIGMYLLNGLYGLGWPVTWWCVYQNRKRIVGRYNILNSRGMPELECKDYCCLVCCTPCVVCQHVRELELRGARPQ